MQVSLLSPILRFEKNANVELLLHPQYSHLSHIQESHWQDYHRFTTAQLPLEIRSWLLDSGSLTQRLLKTSRGDFSVRVLQQGWQQPRFSETVLLGMAQRETAIIREVALVCYGKPWVFARSVIPASSIQGNLRRLRKFDDSPLGALLFKDPSMEREAFEIAPIKGASQQIPKQLRCEESLWGRRSKFTLSGKPLMVSEIFLSDFKP